MAILSPRLRRLDGALLALPAEDDAMLLSDLDGYLAGVIVCPEPILPAEWLPRVWGGDGDEPPFDDARDAAWFVQQVIEHHDAVAGTLARKGGRYEPLFDVDVRHDEVLWEVWIDGFEVAMQLRPDSWAAIVESGDEGAADALAGMITLAQIARDESDLDRAAIDALTLEAPDLIAQWVVRLNAWQLAQGIASPPAAPLRPVKVGRNEACPCGSGKKHKRCCGSA